jgi:hypothetical protein
MGDVRGLQGMWPARPLLLALALAACSAPPSPPPPPPAPLAAPAPGREPLSPPGTEGLRAAPCAKSVDLSRTAASLRAFSPAGRSLTGRTLLSFTTATPSARWIGSSSRPDALRFEERGPGAVELLAGEAGVTLVELPG